MGRESEVVSASKNPAKYFLEWKSNGKVFSYYDKDKAANFEIKLPFKFLFLKQMATVKGWHDQSSSGIYSNEVANTSEQPLNVKSFKGGPIVSGLYKDIKNTVAAAGGFYHRSVYLMTEKGALLNLSLKGTAVAEWNEFCKSNLSKMNSQWVTVSGARDGKKGSVNYSVPVFELSAQVTPEQGAAADVLYDSLVEYIDGNKQQDTSTQESSGRVDATQTASASASVPEPPQSTFTEDEEDSDLPF